MGLPEEDRSPDMGPLVISRNGQENGSPHMGPSVIPQNEQATVGVSMTLIRLAYSQDLEDKTSVVYRNLKTDVVKTV